MTWLRHILHSLIITLIPQSMRKNALKCEEVAHILAEDRQLKFTRKIALKVHLLICQSCVNYKKQLENIDHEVKKYHLVHLNEEQKRRLENSKEDLIKRISGSK